MRQQQMLGGDVLVLEVGGFLEGLVEDARFSAWLRPGWAAGAGDARQFFLDRVQIAFEPLGGDADLFKDGGDDAFAVFEQGEQEMDGLDLGVAEFGGALLRLLDCLLRLDGEFFPTNGHENSS